MKLGHILIIILQRRGEQIVIAPNYTDVSDNQDSGLRESVTYRADYQTSKQAAVARIRNQAGYLTLC